VKRFLVMTVVVFTFSVRASANSQSQIYLRNALHFYQVHNYEKARKYFVAVLSEGSAREQSVARRYLAYPELRRGPTRPSRRLPQPAIESEQLLPEETLAPEREKNVSRESGESRPPTVLSGYLREEGAYRESQPQNLSLLRTTIFANLTGQMAEGITYRVSGRLYYDAVFDLTSQYPEAVSDEEKRDAEFRDTYMDISKGNWDIRIGKQQIVWGEAIGTFIADVVNARDLRESVLPSFDFIRIPQWGTDVEYRRSDFHIEGIWLPTPVMDRVPRPGAEFAPALPVIPDYQIVFQHETQPSDSLKNGEFGGRISYLLAGWDLSAFYFRTWDKEPVYLRTIEPGVITLFPTHPRITYDGFTFSKELSAVVLKGEMTYTEGKYFSTTDLFSPTGVVSKNTIQYLVGADHTFDNSLQLNLQMTQKIIQHYQDDLFMQNPRLTSVSARIERPFWNERLVPSFEAIVDFPYRDYLLRPAIGYKWASHWSIQTGFDLFGGSQDGPFGQFGHHDRVYTSIRYDFGLSS
jgi:hypothetical protein